MMLDPTTHRANISILLSFYKNTPTLQLAESITSILTGSCLPKQIILISDGPLQPDASKLLDIFADNPLFTIIYHEHNLGHARALNSGLELCTSPFVLRLDPDDILTTDALYQHTIAHSTYPTVDIFTADVLEVVADTEYSNISDCYLKKTPRSGNSITELLPYFNTVNHPAVSFKLQSILTIGGYQSYPGFDDYDLWLRALHFNLTFSAIPSYTVFMRRSSFTTRRHGLKYAMVEARFFFRSFFHSYISLKHYLFSLTRIPLRLLPPDITNTLYKLTRQSCIKTPLPFPWGPEHLVDTAQHIDLLTKLLQRVS